MIFAPLDLNRIAQTVQTPNGWIELATIAGCFLVAWAVDRWARLARRGESRAARISVGSFNRLLFPLAALALLVLARSVVRQWFPTNLFAVAIPLMVALA